jgi:hypothetical protein
MVLECNTHSFSHPTVRLAPSAIRGSAIAVVGSGGDGEGLAYSYGVVIMVAVSTLAWTFMVAIPGNAR